MVSRKMFREFFVIEVRSKGFPKGLLRTVRNGKAMVRKFKTMKTARRAMRALLRKRLGEFVSVGGRVQRIKFEDLVAKIKKVRRKV